MRWSWEQFGRLKLDLRTTRSKSIQNWYLEWSKQQVDEQKRQQLGPSEKVNKLWIDELE